ncbi:hypothetical protein ACFOSO_16630 [Planomonospora venezuelensis]|uniref:hypothetical protein n=1 Tax=Planomonospora venezuelensis TaxID=1999 RepID=UPI003609A97B
MWRWLPAVSLAAFLAVVLEVYGVAPSDTAAFAGYLVVGVTVPGVLVLRALLGGRRTLAEELAAGTALGYAVEVFVYIGGRAAGVPLLVVAWPVVTYGVFLAVPRLRGHWRGRGACPRPPVWWSWSVAAVMAYLTLLSATSFFRSYTVTQPGVWAGASDMLYHLSLVGELRHHMPPTVPAVAGEPLLYHWFVYAHLAAASWVTGIEPMVLLLRLGMVPMLAGLLVLVGVTGRRLTGSWLGGVLTVVGTVFLKPPNLHQGPNWTFTYGGIQDVTWTSPTQTFGALLFAPVVLLLLDLLGRGRGGWGRWVLLGVFLVAVMGAKSVYLPLLGAGLVAVVAVEVVRRRRVPRVAVAVLGATAVCLAFAQLVLFGGGKLGMALDPFSLMRMGWNRIGGMGAPAETTVLGLAGLYLMCWAVAWAGVFGLLSRPRLPARPGVPLMLGIGAAGLGVALLFGHPGLSQLFFLMAALPYLSAVAACGLIAVVRQAGTSARATVLAAAAGAAAAFVVPALFGAEVPIDPDHAVPALFRPYIVLGIAVVALTAVLAAAVGGLRACALTAVALTALSLPGNVNERVLVMADRIAKTGFQQNSRPVEDQVMPPKALNALRWLRMHSRPDELVATNVHCAWDLPDPCPPKRFWVSAFAERRVLFEGWAYTAANLRQWRPGGPNSYPFWDHDRFLANKRVFTQPSPGTVGDLRERYGVRWLFVDESRMGPGRGLETAARLRFRSGDYSLYRVPDADVPGQREP